MSERVAARALHGTAEDDFGDPAEADAPLWAGGPADVCQDSQWAIIVGAPRCGTSSLSAYLAGHRAVCFSNVKEPHFFATTDLRGQPELVLRRRIRDEYLARYFPHRGPPRMLAEGSVTYLYVPEQLEPVVRLWPQAKFIVGVRNPLTFVPSLHQRLCYNGDETVRDFGAAWRLVPERRQGRLVPRGCANWRWLDYWEAGRLGKYVERLFRTVGRERCFVYLFEEFAADPARVYGEVLRFLQLPDDGRREFPVHRPSRDFRVGWLQRALKRPPAGLLKLGGEGYRRVLLDGPEAPCGAVTRSLWNARDRILAWNLAPAPQVPLGPELRAEMTAAFGDDVVRLGELLGRDLGHWLVDPGMAGHADQAQSAPSPAAVRLAARG